MRCRTFSATGHHQWSSFAILEFLTLKLPVGKDRFGCNLSPSRSRLRYRYCAAQLVVESRSRRRRSEITRLLK
jgi:hypothetical protein